MANLPTAYASQRFGRKTLDFYAVEGDVVGADPRARSEERRLEDMDGQRHTVRLMEKGFELTPGQTATVLRMQPGPARRSRPVAVVNHDTGGWCRTHPGAEGLLAKAGVSRTFNWVLTMGLFAIAALVLVWPFLRSFLVEVDPSLFGGAPNFNVAEMTVAALPALAGWSFSDAIAPITAPLISAMPGLSGVADMLVFGAGILVASLGVYLLRSWRLLWAPVFVALIGVIALGYGGVTGMVGPALSGLGLAALLFLVGGVINRIRDGARLEARIAVLSDHLLRQGPQDVVVPVEEADDAPSADEPANDEVDAVVPAGVAAAASLREPGQDDGEEVAPEESDEAAEGAPSSQEAERVEDEGADASESEADSETSEPDAVTVSEATGSEDALDAEAVEAVEATETTSASDAEGLDESQGAEAAGPEVESADPADTPDEDIEASDVDAVAEPVEDTVDAETVPETANEAEPIEVSDATPADVTSEDGIEPSADDSGTEAVPSAEAMPLTDSEDGEAPADPSADGASGAPIPGDTAPAGLDPEEAERLRTDPRYASRAIVLPPPPPMPTPGPDLGEGSGEAVGQGETTMLKPSAPLPGNVIPIFAAPASSEIPQENRERPHTPEAANEDEPPREPS